MDVGGLGFRGSAAAGRGGLLEANANRNSPPSVVADAIGRAVTAPRPKTRYVVGDGARPLISARSILTDRQFDSLITRATGLPRG